MNGLEGWLALAQSLIGWSGDSCVASRRVARLALVCPPTRPHHLPLSPTIFGTPAPKCLAVAGLAAYSGRMQGPGSLSFASPMTMPTSLATTLTVWLVLCMSASLSDPPGVAPLCGWSVARAARPMLASGAARSMSTCSSGLSSHTSATPWTTGELACVLPSEEFLSMSMPISCGIVIVRGTPEPGPTSRAPRPRPVSPSGVCSYSIALPWLVAGYIEAPTVGIFTCTSTTLTATSQVGINCDVSVAASAWTVPISGASRSMSTWL